MTTQRANTATLHTELEPVETGKYGALEGIDGAGSTTQLNDYVIPWFERNGILLGNPTKRHSTAIGDKLVVTREPGGTQIGEVFRDILLHRKDLELSAHTEYDLFRAQRRELAHQIVIPKLKLGKYIISERCYLSSYAYQGARVDDNGEQVIDVEMILRTSQRAIGPRMAQPDAWVILELEPKIALERVLARDGVDEDKIESRGLEYFERVHLGYMALAERFNIPKVDAKPEPDIVGQAVIEAFAKQLDLPVN